MEFEKSKGTNKIILIVFAAIIVSSLLTLFGANFYYTQTDSGNVKIIERSLNISDARRKYELLSVLRDEHLEISDTSKKIEAKIELVRTYIDKYYLGEIDEQKQIDWAIKGYIRGLRR